MTQPTVTSYPPWSIVLRIVCILLLLLAIFGVGPATLPLWAAVCYVASTFL